MFSRQKFFEKKLLPRKELGIPYMLLKDVTRYIDIESQKGKPGYGNKLEPK